MDPYYCDDCWWGWEAEDLPLRCPLPECGSNKVKPGNPPGPRPKPRDPAPQ